MASTSSYEQQNFWKTPDLSLLGDNWMNEQIEKHKKKMISEGEKLFYTAQDGSTLDRIWKGEFNKNNPDTKDDLDA